LQWLLVVVAPVVVLPPLTVAEMVVVQMVLPERILLVLVVPEELKLPAEMVEPLGQEHLLEDKQVLLVKAELVGNGKQLLAVAVAEVSSAAAAAEMTAVVLEVMAAAAAVEAQV
jgi:hypothetical protein